MKTRSGERTWGKRGQALLVGVATAVAFAMAAAGCGTVGTVDPPPETDEGPGMRVAPVASPVDLAKGSGGAAGDGGGDAGGAGSGTGGGGGAGGSSALPCAGDLELCLDVCIDLRVDPLNCGRCGNLCGLAEICQEGSCTTL